MTKIVNSKGFLDIQPELVYPQSYILIIGWIDPMWIETSCKI